MVLACVWVGVGVGVGVWCGVPWRRVVWCGVMWLPAMHDGGLALVGAHAVLVKAYRAGGQLRWHGTFAHINWKPIGSHQVRVTGHVRCLF